MKRNLNVAALVMFAVMIASTPVSAQSLANVAGSVSTYDTVKPAGTSGNHNVEFYYTPDGHAPTREDRWAKDGGPDFYQASNLAEITLPRYSPSNPNGKCWVVVSFFAINADEITHENITVQTADGLGMVDRREDLGGYLLDLSSLPAGRHFIDYQLKHMGGEATTQVLIFRFRRKREIDAEDGFVLNLVNPNKGYTAEHLELYKYMTNMETSDGHFIVKSATGEAPPVRILKVNDPPSQQAEASDCSYQRPEAQTGSGRVCVNFNKANGAPYMGGNPDVIVEVNGQVVSRMSSSGTDLAAFDNIPSGEVRILVEQADQQWQFAPDNYNQGYSKTLVPDGAVRFKLIQVGRGGK
ncbi:hypothetical protein KC644_02605 [Candidatus Berkelbacteria bacterium]|nr:hypothetical protein [Candidatus Berkelbacteria bacterium]